MTWRGLADLMTRAAEYAREAAEVFASMQPQDVQTLESFAFSLYWVVLNFATLCRLGGGGQWTANQVCVCVCVSGRESVCVSV